MEQRLCEWPAGTDGAPKAISRLEGQIEEQVFIFNHFKSTIRLKLFYYRNKTLSKNRLIHKSNEDFKKLLRIFYQNK